MDTIFPSSCATRTCCLSSPTVVFWSPETVSCSLTRKISLQPSFEALTQLTSGKAFRMDSFNFSQLTLPLKQGNSTPSSNRYRSICSVVILVKSWNSTDQMKQFKMATMQRPVASPHIIFHFLYNPDKRKGSPCFSTRTASTAVLWTISGILLYSSHDKRA